MFILFLFGLPDVPLIRFPSPFMPLVHLVLNCRALVLTG